LIDWFVPLVSDAHADVRMAPPVAKSSRQLRTNLAIFFPLSSTAARED
jgi:hypothetical protein